MKESKPENLTVRSKIWIQDENGEVVFGSGRLRILEAVSRNGSIHAAAQELGMSYRAVWGKIRATEKRMGIQLLERKTGGVHGGGSELTPLAQKIVLQFEKLQSLVRDSADKSFSDLFVSGRRGD